MNRKKLVNQPIPQILSLFPGDENFGDTRDTWLDGAWISREAWRNIYNRLHSSNDDNVSGIIAQIQEENPNVLKDDGNEGVFLSDYQFAFLEKELSAKKEKERNSSKQKDNFSPNQFATIKKSNVSYTKKTAPETKGVASKETWEQRNLTPHLRAICEAAKRKKEIESK